jgi:hypothetical protein
LIDIHKEEHFVEMIHNSHWAMQNHYIKVAQGAIFMEHEIWADFGLVGNTKKIGADYE